MSRTFTPPPPLPKAALTFIMGDNPDGRVYLAEDAPPDLIRSIHRALDRAVPRVDPAAEETP